ncbi:hypothetical protein HPP92_027828 [Vanilla planifolia]|uniref:Uncharacterized protein n=1 Tax=Vanilla planifolia TaxID=51239 RepID=A0A835PAB6_VANPL|nr:hypothetical protein HPP92_027828 [Vanilla planifolia]
MVESSKPCFFRNISSCCPDDRDTHTVVADRGQPPPEESHSPSSLSRFETGGPSVSFSFITLWPSYPKPLFPSPPASASSSSPPSRRQTLEHQLPWRAVLPKFYASEVQPTRRVFCLREAVGGDGYPEGDGGTVREGVFGLMWWGSEVGGGKMLGDSTVPEIGIGHRRAYSLLSALCKEAYVVSEKLETEESWRRLPLRLIVFHDGRLVQKVTPLRALPTVVCSPSASSPSHRCGPTLPMPFVSPSCLLGVRIIVKGPPPPLPLPASFVCSPPHLLDPIFLSAASDVLSPPHSFRLLPLRALSPITTVRLPQPLH